MVNSSAKMKHSFKEDIVGVCLEKNEEKEEDLSVEMINVVLFCRVI